MRPAEEPPSGWRVTFFRREINRFGSRIKYRMSRYRLRVHGPCKMPRTLGLEDSDLVAAMIRGNRMIARMLTRGGTGPDTIRGHIDVEDEQERVVARLLFSDVARGIAA